MMTSFTRKLTIFEGAPDNNSHSHVDHVAPDGKFLKFFE